MSIEVREATPDEYDEAGRVTSDSYRELVRTGEDDWSAYLDTIADIAARAGRTTVLVAVEAGRILGSATLELDGRTEPESEPLPSREAHIRMLGVSADTRRRGVAKMLMAACEDRARAAGRTRMTLNTTSRMAAAQLMYESLGYEREPDRVFPDGFVLLSYAKRL